MLLQRLKDVSFIQVPVETSLRLVQLASLIQVPVVTLLARLRLVGFVYAPLRRCKDVSNRSVLLTYQLKRRDDVSAWFRTFTLGTRMGEYLLGKRQYIFSVPASVLLQCLKDVSFIYVPAVTSLGHVKLVSLAQVSIGTSLRRLKLLGLHYVPMRHHKNVSNRSASFTYQS